MTNAKNATGTLVNAHTPTIKDNGNTAKEALGIGEESNAL